MNILFLKFIIFFILFLCVIGLLSILIWKKKLQIRDLYVTTVFTIMFTITLLCFSYGIKMNNELKNQFNFTHDRVSHVNYKDSTINDSLLYSMIKDLRIPHAKIVFAQAKIESANYKSELYKSNFNLFGMKFATIRPTITTNEYLGYQKYDNWKESLCDYLIWQFANNVDKLSDEKYLDYLDSVYAEDPNYILKIKKIISSYNFIK